MDTELGRFGHHPEPATDFCVEVDMIEGLLADWRAGLEDIDTVRRRVFRAMYFTVGGDERAVMAKNRLRAVEAAVS